MTIEEIFNKLFEKYGSELTWRMLPPAKSQDTFVDELKRELGEENELFHNRVYSVAKCDSNDDVLFSICNGSSGELLRIYHLTYALTNSPGFPKYEEFTSANAVGDFIENNVQLTGSSFVGR